MIVKVISKEDYSKLRKKIIHYIREHQNDKRFDHTLRVEKEALRLANMYDIDLQQASISALLHDVAKNYSDRKKLRMVHKYNIPLSKIEQDNIDMAHSKIGSYIAAHKFKVEDIDILNGIKYHTTGRPRMSELEKIIYIADFIEPGRNEFPGLEKARSLAYEDLDIALIKILMLTLNHVIDKGGAIDGHTEKAYEYYYKIYNDKKKEGQ